MRTIEATREVVQAAKSELNVKDLPIGTVLFVFLWTPGDEGDKDTVPVVQFVRAKWVASGLTLALDGGISHRLRVRRTEASEGDGVSTFEPPHLLKTGDVLEYHTGDGWKFLPRVIGIHVA